MSSRGSCHIFYNCETQPLFYEEPLEGASGRLCGQLVRRGDDEGGRSRWEGSVCITERDAVASELLGDIEVNLTSKSGGTPAIMTRIRCVNDVDWQPPVAWSLGGGARASCRPDGASGAQQPGMKASSEVVTTKPRNHPSWRTCKGCARKATNSSSRNGRI